MRYITTTANPQPCYIVTQSQHRPAVYHRHTLPASNPIMSSTTHTRNQQPRSTTKYSLITRPQLANHQSPLANNQYNIRDIYLSNTNHQPATHSPLISLCTTNTVDVASMSGYLWSVAGLWSYGGSYLWLANYYMRLVVSYWYIMKYW